MDKKTANAHNKIVRSGQTVAMRQISGKQYLTQAAHAERTMQSMAAALEEQGHEVHGDEVILTKPMSAHDVNTLLLNCMGVPPAAHDEYRKAHGLA